MEHLSNENSDEQRQELSRDAGSTPGDTDVRVEIMNRQMRQDALAWAQAYKLIRGSVDEVVQIVEGSQYTIELLLQTLREAACRQCSPHPPDAPPSCEFCRRRDELLSQLT